MSDIEIESAEIIRKFMAALENNEKDEAESYLADDFIFSGWTPKSLNKSGFLSMISGIKEGIPGLIFNLHNVLEENQQRVTATWQIAGYQSDSFLLTSLGLPPIPQMARSVSLPSENVVYMLTNGQIRSLAVEATPGGGLEGLLHQLGIHVPIIQ